MSENGDPPKQLNGSPSSPANPAGEGNRLKVHEDKNSANCELVGLLPFNATTSAIALGYENALAIQLAIQHLNEGNGSLVAEVSDLPMTCPITFSASFVDSKHDASVAFKVMDELTRPSNEPGPCAIIGGLDSQVSRVTGLMTGLKGIPQISPGTTNSYLDDKSSFPLFGRTVPSDSDPSAFFLRFLRDTMGIRHIFVIYESHPFTRSMVTSLRNAIFDNGWAPGKTLEQNISNNAMFMEDRIFESVSDDVIHQVIKELKESGYRFVLALTSGITTTDRLMEIAYDEGVIGTDDGAYQWWFTDTLENILKEDRRFEKDGILAKAYSGVGSVGWGEKNRASDLDKKFREQSRELKRELYRRHSEMVSKTNAEFGDSSTGEYEWLFGSQVPFVDESEWLPEGTYYYGPPVYAYDATILLGLSACNEVAAISKNLNTTNLDTIASTFQGKDHFNRLRQTNFTGVTGNVQLDEFTGSRDASTVNYAVNNWLPSDDDDYNITFRPTTAYVFKGHGNWENLNPFVFSDGKTSLRQEPDLPPLNIKIENVPIAMFIFWSVALAVILLLTIGFAVWTCRHWNSRVVRASQPFFLLLLCLGIAIMSVAIVFINLEYSNMFMGNWTCNLCISPFIIGFGIVFSTLFAKTYRINRILMSAKKCKRIELTVRQTIFPVALLVSFNIGMLVLIRFLTPITKETFSVDFDPFGRPKTQMPVCNHKQAKPLIWPLFAVNIAVVFLALYQAWRARDLSTEFAESKYIAIALLLCIVISALGTPLLFFLEEKPIVDTFIKSFCVFIYSVSILFFIFLPKMKMHYNGPVQKKRSNFLSNSARTSTGHSNRTNETSRSSGEQIVTRKSQFELTNEIKCLETKLAMLQERERKTDVQNVKLRRRIKELSNDDDNDIDIDLTVLPDRASEDSFIGNENEMKYLDCTHITDLTDA